MTKETNLPQIEGKVAAYAGNGRKLGYPTANLSTSSSLDDGVYFGFADLYTYKHQPALIFIGVPTTVGDKLRRVEAHLLDITDKDYYGQHLKLVLHHFHRPNQKFASVEQLIEAIKSDEDEGRRWFKKHELAHHKHIADT